MAIADQNASLLVTDVEDLHEHIQLEPAGHDFEVDHVKEASTSTTITHVRTAVDVHIG